MPLRFTHRILEHLAHTNYEPATGKAIARQLGTDPQDRAVFQKAIDQLREQGRVDITRDELVALPSYGEEVEGVFRLTSRGFGFVIPDHPCREGDLFVPPGGTRDAISGDRVRAKVIRQGGRSRGRPGRSPFTGRILEVLERGRDNFVGVLFERGDLDGAQARYEVSLELSLALRDRATEAVALLKLASVARERADFDRADALLAKASGAPTEVEDPRRSPVLDEIGRVLLARGRPAAARERFEAALTSARDVGDRRGEAISLYDLGRASAALKEGSDAMARLGEAVEVASELEADELAALAQVAQAEVHLAGGDRKAADAALATAEVEAKRRGRVLATRFALARAQSVGQTDPALAKALLQDVGDQARRQGFTTLAEEAAHRAKELE